MKAHWKLILAGTGAIAVGLLLVLWPGEKSKPVFPVPNGYDDFLKAGKIVGRDFDHTEALDEEIRSAVEDNRPALELARLGCSRTCRVTVDYGQSAADYAGVHMPVLSGLKRIALAFRLEGLLAEREGRPNEAARSYLDGIRFGQEMARGGLLIDRLVGIATEAIAFNALSNVVGKLDARACREIAQALQKAEAAREPWSATMRQETEYFRAVTGTLHRLVYKVVRVVNWVKSVGATPPDPRQKLERLQRWEGQLVVQLAARSMALDGNSKASGP